MIQGNNRIILMTLRNDIIQQLSSKVENLNYFSDRVFAPSIFASPTYMPFMNVSISKSDCDDNGNSSSFLDPSKLLCMIARRQYDKWV